MIKIFKSDEEDFTTDGLEVLDDIAISSFTDWSEKNIWTLEAKFKRDNLKSEVIENELIIQVETEKGEQLFRIKKVNKKSNKYITVYAKHISYDFNDNFIIDTNIVMKTGRAAIQQISGAMEYSHKFNISSNIDTVASSRLVRRNGIEALVGIKDNSFANRWGGYLVVDNFNISMNESVGEDRGVEIAIGKNIIDFDGEINDEGICTGIHAIAYDGVTLPEKIYYSDLVSNYPFPKIKEYEFNDIKYKYSENNFNAEGFETLEETYNEIRKACDELFNKQNIDKPKCNLRVNIVALENTDQYLGDELAERIFQGDIVTANLKDYGFNIKLKMIANRYDNIRKRYIDIDLGNAKSNILNDFSSVNDKLGNLEDKLGDKTWEEILQISMDEASKLLAAGIKDSYVVARQNEILVMDSPILESARNVIRINKNGIGFSENGYNGPYSVAITIDGKINASHILTGILSAALIKTGTLISADGKVSINLDNGAFTLTNDNGVVIIDGEHNIHKIISTGIMECNMPVGVNQRNFTVTHNMGYHPHVACSQLMSGDTRGVPLPAYNFSASASNLEISQAIRCRTTTEVLEINILRSAELSNNEETFRVRYFIYKEVAF